MTLKGGLIDAKSQSPSFEYLTHVTSFLFVIVNIISKDSVFIIKIVPS